MAQPQTVSARPSQMVAELEGLSRTIEELGARIGHLRERLAPVTRVQPSPPTIQTSDKEEVLTAHAETIRSARRQVDGLKAAVDDLMNSLEV